MELTQQPPVIVHFEGERAAEGPLTLGQLNILEWLEADPDGSDHYLPCRLDVGNGADIDAVTGALSALVSRHEGLRTRYLDGNGPRLRVARSGTLPVSVYLLDWDAGRLEATPLAAELASRIVHAPAPDDRAGLPVRAALATVSGVVRAAVISCSHLAVDAQAMTILGREFAELLRGRAARRLPRPHQPLEQAAAEREPAMRPRLDSALRYLEQQLRQMPTDLYAGPPLGGPSGAAALWMSSPASALALRRIAARTGASRATAVLAACGAVLSYRTGYQVCRFPTMSGNRFEPRLYEYVGTLAQATMLQLEVGTAGFDQLVRRAYAAMLDGGRNGLYDAHRLAGIIGRVEYERGMVLPLRPAFNSLVFETRPAGVRPIPTMDQVHAAAARTRLAWQDESPSSQSLRIRLIGVDGVLRLRAVTGGTSRVPHSELESLLTGVDRLLIAAAEGDLDHDAMRRVVGLDPLVRGADWACVDSCWVELSEVRRLVGDALAPAASAVFAEPEGRGLVAYLAAGPAIRTPVEAHKRCMAALPDQPTAMAPSYYVLCGGAPDDPSGLDSWRQQPVLSEGTGRTDALETA